MAIYTVYDVESTGLHTGSANVLTFSYASFYGRDIFEPREAGTLFFFKKEWKIPVEASKVNRLTEEIMAPHIPDFRVNCRKMWKILQRGNLVGQNIKSYDNVLVKSFLKRQGYGELNFNRIMDIRYGLGKSASLEELIEKLDIKESVILDYWKSIFPNSLFTEEDVLHHNGEYDVVATTLCWIKLCAMKAKGFEGVN